MNLREQIEFLIERRYDYIKIMEYRRTLSNGSCSSISIKKINNNISCYDAVLISLKELQNLKNNPHGK